MEDNGEFIAFLIVIMLGGGFIFFKSFFDRENDETLDDLRFKRAHEEQRIQIAKNRQQRHEDKIKQTKDEHVLALNSKLTKLKDQKLHL